jgi:hypothetical protein
MNNTVHAVHNFSKIDESCPFDPIDYSFLKFGCRKVAKKFGYELAESFFAKHTEALISQECVVIPSPYNYVKNAATVMTEFFVERLNQLLAESCGKSVEYSTIHRKVSYTADYGFLSKEKRKQLLSNDQFYANSDFLAGKTLIFVDDVKITGTHEDKLLEIIDNYGLYEPNGHFFLYFANYEGDTPDIESKLNFAGIKYTFDVVHMINQSTTDLIIRPIKYILSTEHIDTVLNMMLPEKLEKIYKLALSEGYYKIPTYQQNLNAIKNHLKDVLA